MAENETPELTPEVTPDETPDETPDAALAESPVAPATDPKPRLRDLAFSFRALVAVGLATLLIGGAGGAAIVAATDDDHDRPYRMGRLGDMPNGPGRDGFGPREGYGGPGGGFPGGPAPDQQDQQQDQQDDNGSAG